MKTNRALTTLIAIILLVVMAFTFCGCEVVLEYLGLGSELTITAEYLGEPIEQGQSLNKEDFVVTATFKDGLTGTTDTYNVSAFTISNFDSTTVGEQPATITYTDELRQKTATTTVVVTVVEKVVLTGITATYIPVLTVQGSTLTNQQFEVFATYSDGVVNKIDNFELSNADTSTVGSLQANVTFTDKDVTKTTTAEVVVVSPQTALTEISVNCNLQRYYAKEQLKTTDFTVTATFSQQDSDQPLQLQVFDFSLSLEKFEVEGNQDLTITYSFGGKEKSCTVTIEVFPPKNEIPNYGTYGVISTDGKEVRVVKTAEVNSQTQLQIHFLELGNQYAGDCTYIRAGDVDILIDAGSRKSSAKTIASYLDSVNFDGTFEYVVATHAHQDHIAGFVGSTTKGEEGILKRYECETIINYSLSDSTTAIRADYEKLCDDLKAQGTNVYTALECYQTNNASARFTQSVNTEGARRYIKLADNLEMEILYNYYYDHTTKDENDYSVCLLINQYGAGYDYSNPNAESNKEHVNSFLFTGDLEESGEEYLVEYNDLPHCVLFKGGHHGSPTSTTAGLLAEINPKVVCLCTCVGSDEYTDNLANQFPGLAMMQRLSAYTDMLFATSIYDASATGSFRSFNGNITVTSNDKGVLLRGSNGVELIKDSVWFKNRYTEWSPNMALRTDAV